MGARNVSGQESNAFWTINPLKLSPKFSMWVHTFPGQRDEKFNKFSKRYNYLSTIATGDQTKYAIN